VGVIRPVSRRQLRQGGTDADFQVEMIDKVSPACLGFKSPDRRCSAVAHLHDIQPPPLWDTGQRQLRSLLAFFAPLQVIPIACRSYLKVARQWRQVFCVPCLCLPEMGSQFMAKLAGLSSGSMYLARFSLMILTMSTWVVTSPFLELYH